MKLARVLLMIPVLALAGLAMSATTAYSWPSICDNCYKGVNRFGEPDAQCCLEGSCGIWQDDPDYSLWLANMEWCTSWVTETEAGCNGEAYSCSAGGGGDGDEDDCTIQVGEWCPPSCSHCYVVY